VSLLFLVVDDEPDVEMLFRQQFRRDLRADRFAMEFAHLPPAALQRITGAAIDSLILLLSDMNMPGMSGLELLPKAKAARPDVPIIMITALLMPRPSEPLEGGAAALLTKPGGPSVSSDLLPCHWLRVRHQVSGWPEPRTWAVVQGSNK
jgi:CheY-like chemotaxis protein